MDLSRFLEKQRLADAPLLAPGLEQNDRDDDDVDTSLAHISSKPLSLASGASRKGKVEQIVWDDELDKLSQEKAAAEAARGTFSYFFPFNWVLTMVMPCRPEKSITRKIGENARKTNYDSQGSLSRFVNTTSSIPFGLAHAV